MISNKTIQNRSHIVVANFDNGVDAYLGPSATDNLDKYDSTMRFKSGHKDKMNGAASSKNPKLWQVHTAVDLFLSLLQIKLWQMNIK